MGTQLYQLFLRGGPVMYPLALCSLIAVTIVIERLLFLRATRKAIAGFLPPLRHAVSGGQLPEAMKLCDGAPIWLGRLFRSGLSRMSLGQKEVRTAFVEASALEVPYLERWIGILSTIAHVAPLLGLLGTVTGMIKCFQEIQRVTSGGAPVSPTNLAGGIWEALITTAAGLIIAIPVYIAYNYFVVATGRIVNELERYAAEMVDIVFSRERRMQRTLNFGPGGKALAQTQPGPTAGPGTAANAVKPAGDAPLSSAGVS
jgi:biopolymer transport protein ExbB